MDVTPAMGRTSLARIFASMGKVASGKAGAALLSLAYLAIGTRTLGPENFGVLVLVHGYAVTVGGLFEFPAWQAIVRYGAEAEREGDHNRLSRLLRFSTRVELSGGLAGLLAAALLAPLVGPQLGWSETALAMALPYSFAVLGSMRAAPAGYLQLIDRFGLLGWHNLVAPGVRLVGAVMAASLGLGLHAFLVVWLVAALAECLSLWGMAWFLAQKRLGRTLLSPSPGNVVKENSGLWSFVVASNTDTKLSELAGRATPLIVGAILGPAAAGLYAVAHRAGTVIAQPAQILGNTAYPELARMIASGQSGAPLRQTLTRVISLATAACIPLVLIAWMASEQIVLLFAGKDFLDAAPLLAALVTARAIAVGTKPCSAALTALGRPSWSAAVNLGLGLVFLPLLAVLLQRYELVGAGWQALLQAATATATLMVLVRLRSRAAEQTP